MTYIFKLSSKLAHTEILLFRQWFLEFKILHRSFDKCNMWIDLENEEVMVHYDIYSHIESYKHLNWNHMKDRKGKYFLDTVTGAHQPWWFQYGIMDVTIPETETAWNTKMTLFSWMSLPLSNAGGTFPGNPLELIKAFVPL